MNPTTYRSYKNLPSVAGLCTMQDAMNPGLTVEECVRRLKHLHYALKRLHEIFTSRITSEPIMELKNGFSLHAYICAEHVAAIRKRIKEMREPPLGLDAVPDEHLKIFFDELLGAPIANSQVRYNADFGILLMTLHTTSYDWRFVAQKTGAVIDSGSTVCH